MYCLADASTVWHLLLLTDIISPTTDQLVSQNHTLHIYACSVFTDLTKGLIGFNQYLTTNSKLRYCKTRAHFIINNPVYMLCYTI